MRTRARWAGACAAAAAALLLTGCGGGDGGDDDAGGETPPPGTTQPSDAPSGPEKGDDVTLEDIQGGWMTEGLHVDEGLVILAVFENSVTVSAESACSGTVDGAARPMTMKLACDDGSTDFAGATVRSLTDGKLTVEWAGGETTVLSRSPGPEDLPELPTDVPTELPGLPESPDLPGTES
ncbi:MULTISPECIES: hypothetical protein [unclassified Streptomyces]|uniref:hypothetical protein n=1 Tax=unclassified Streptomyces TaxID=2593676 RepID=UPI0022B6D7C2|nr:MULTISPECIES: hypothetical protein [unclassified Streptomyces]MCZ7417335.1 hypothetical protein [Streptomyces sp. WMMC897]MCZ7432838.1 hypothetical protein [Streptomyces sp. WMMC1477]